MKLSLNLTFGSFEELNAFVALVPEEVLSLMLEGDTIEEPTPWVEPDWGQEVAHLLARGGSKRDAALHLLDLGGPVGVPIEHLVALGYDRDIAYAAKFGGAKVQRTPDGRLRLA